MENISSKKIAIQIFGNPESNGGFQSIVTINGLIPLLTDIPYSGVSNNPYFYVLKTASNYTQFTLVHNRAKSNSANRAGSLKIAVGIPSGTVLKDNVSPNQLIKEVFTVFTNMCMETQSDGELVYKPNVLSMYDTLKSDITTLLSKYQLVDCIMPHRAMIEGGQRGLFQVSYEMIDDLFRDIQYPEFTKFGEVVVAQQADTSQYAGRVITNLPIPRKRNFKIFVNGKLTSKILSSDAVTISAYNDGGYDRNCYEEQLISLTPEDIIAGKDKPGINFNFVEERIDVTMTPQKKTINLTIIVDGCTLYSDMKLMVGTMTIPIKGQISSYSLDGEQIKKLFTNRTASLSFTVQGYQPENSNPPIIRKNESEYEINLAFKRIESRQYSGGSTLAKVSTEPNLYINLKGFDPHSYDEKKYEKAISSYDNRNVIRLKITQNDEESKYIVNAPIKKEDRRKFLHVKLPSDWIDKLCSVSMPEWKLKCERTSRLTQKTELTIDDFQKIEETKKIRLSQWIILGSCIVLSFLAGLCIGKFLLGGNTTPPPPTEIKKKAEEPKVVEYNPQKSYDYYQDEFDKEDLTFATIQQCQRWINDTILKGKHQDKLTDFNQFKEMVDAYNDVINTILTEDGTNALKTVLNKYKETDGNFKLKSIHIDLARKAYKGGNAEKIAIRKGLYKDKQKNFKSFQDFKICDNNGTTKTTNKPNSQTPMRPPSVDN